jgi:phosphatidylserine/phosphatidylglycerophosphate/cardiolipin synthase-like enzyme
LGDVARYLRAHGPPPAPHHAFHKPERVRALLADVADDAVLRARFVDPAMPVQGVRFIADLPLKHRRESAGPTMQGGTSAGLRDLIAAVDQELLLQTPYLVLSEPAQALFRELRQRPSPPRVLVSTNSLASTDAFLAYAISYNYKRRYLRDFGFQIHEFKPFPADAPFELGATGADLGEDAPAPAEAAAPVRRPSLRERRLAERRLRSEPESEAGRPSPFGSSGGLPVRLKRAGLRLGLHAKSMVIDGRVGVVGTHNFDPRGDTLNTESAVVIEDPAFARALAASIRHDMAPGNAWTIGRRDDAPIFSGIEYNLAKLSERMPIFDLWPYKYATSYDYTPGPDCPPTAEPPSPFAPGFRRCNRPVGDFPEVDIGLKWLGVRIFTAFGSGLSPIL